MGKRWRFKPHDSARVARLERASGLPPVVAQLLVGRGIGEAEEARTFLEARLGALRDPELLGGATEAADRVHRAIADKRRIVVYGDYDADGMSGTAILYRCLQLLQADVGYYVPNRLDEGYGLNDDALRTLATRGASLIITVDCGIGSVQSARTAKELGLELIITDHHDFGESLPEAAAILHPRLPGAAYPFPGLCGAGVALKLAWAICQRASQAKKVSEPMRNFLLTAVGLAAIGTVADVVPLVDENRILVRHGLISLKERPVPGLAALMQVAKLGDKAELSSEDLAFTIAPRINAAGRLGQAALGIELMTTSQPERAQALAEYLHELNNSRETLERSIYLAANQQIKDDFDAFQDPALVLAGRGWHAGVIGIVAGRLAEKYHRPVVLIAFDALGAKPGIGSARTAGGLNLHAALADCGEHLLSHGGHAAAAGLKIHEANVPAFRAAFCEHAAARIGPEQREAEITIDAEAAFSQLTLEIVQQIGRLEPFGAGNPRPLLMTGDVKLAEPPKRIGSNERHLSLRLVHHNQRLRAVAFGQGEWCDEIAQCPTSIDVAYRPVINEFQGRRNVELHLVDWRPTRVPTATTQARA